MVTNNHRFILATLCKEFNFDQPSKPEDDRYSEIEKFKDFEYTYCIAYEMLIRTTEYKFLLQQYSEVINEISDSEKINELVRQMEKLGLNQKSFMDSDYGSRNVFERIKLYNVLNNKTLGNRTLDEYEDGLHHLIVYYAKKQKLYFAKCSEDELSFEKDTGVDSTNALINHANYYIPLMDKYSPDEKIIYRSLKEKIYLKELDEECLLALNLEDKQKNMLVQVESTRKVTVDFWHKYLLDDLQNGLEMLITFYINRKAIKKCKNDGNSTNEITFIDVFTDAASYCISCADKSSVDNRLVLKPIRKDMPLKIFESEFLSILELSDLKTKPIETIPIFSRPQLFFTCERIIKLPVNLNLSKDELVSYISQIKDEYDNNKDIAKNQIESLFDLVLESDILQMPNSLKKFPIEREKFKKSFALAFYVYDMYEFFYPLFEMKRRNLQQEMELKIKEKKEYYKSYTDPTNVNIAIKRIKERIEKQLKDYEDNSLITCISEYANISEDKFTYFLATMKEFIQGINTNNENDKSKRKKSAKKFEHPEPKYKNIIIGTSFNDYFKKTQLKKDKV
ncbi:MAG: hypothetical protein Q8N32_08055 [Sulfuricurvum sp.]|nr:hypothetical protein [Sulfuricurvum sp.]